jgi:hypothetical protein
VTAFRDVHSQGNGTAAVFHYPESAGILSVNISRDDWKKIASAIGEIERGEFTSFEDLKRGFAAKELARKKGGK